MFSRIIWVPLRCNHSNICFLQFLRVQCARHHLFVWKPLLLGRTFPATICVNLLAMARFAVSLWQSRQNQDSKSMCLSPTLHGISVTSCQIQTLCHPVYCMATLEMSKLDAERKFAVVSRDGRKWCCPLETSCSLNCNLFRRIGPSYWNLKVMNQLC